LITRWAVPIYPKSEDVILVSLQKKRQELVQF